jgi:nucleotide-binding universal stress UspA family protein
MKILIGYDGSQSADAAICDLARAGLPGEADALVLSVAELWMPPPSSYALVETDFAEMPADLEQEANKDAQAACDRIRQLFPRWSVSPKVEWGSPARTILDRAREWESDLVVVGSHGRSALGRFVLGSVANKVVTEAPCSVRVARGRLEEFPAPVRIILGITETPSNEPAVRAVAGRSWPPGSGVRLVTSFGPYEAFGPALQAQIDRIGELHAAAEAELSAAGLAVSSEIREGDPKHVILNEAQRLGADCIFLGTRDLSRAGRFLLGSVSAAVVARALCSVEVARARTLEV